MQQLLSLLYWRPISAAMNVSIFPIPGLASSGGLFLIQEPPSMTTSAVRAAPQPPALVRAPELGQWGRDLASQFQDLSPVFVTLLALWSFGIILGRCCGLDTVSLHLARLLGQSDNTTRQRLREFYQEAPAKAGAKRGVKRPDFDITVCFLPLLRWVLSFWSCPR